MIDEPLLEILMFVLPPTEGGLPLVFSLDSRRSLLNGGGDDPKSSSSRSLARPSRFKSRPLLAMGDTGPPSFSVVAATAAAAAARLTASASRTACNARACSAIRPTGLAAFGSLPRRPGGGGTPAAAAAPAWLYSLKSASRVISRAESGLFGLRPGGGLVLPPVLSEMRISAKFLIKLASFRV